MLLKAYICYGHPQLLLCVPVCVFWFLFLNIFPEWPDFDGKKRLIWGRLFFSFRLLSIVCIYLPRCLSLQCINKGDCDSS